MSWGSTQPKRSRHIKRYREIAVVLSNYRLGEVIHLLQLERFLPFHWVPPSNPFHRIPNTSAERTRMALEHLGTTFIKVGQILSTRTDILPAEYTQEFARLQNSLTPLPMNVIEESIQKELGKPVKELFASFEEVPLGVASIGQVHGAKLLDGTEVVVKIQKPHVPEQVAEDLDILHQITETASKQWKYSNEYDLPRIIEEISEALKDEINYIREAHNAEHFAEFFKSEPMIHVPKVFWKYTTPRVITLERVRGIGILDVKSLTAAGFQRSQLAHQVVNLWTRMIFEDYIFHADPHPGNVFVESDGRIGLVDFGMTGTIDEEVRERLVAAVKAILDRDVDGLIDSLIDLGALARGGTSDNLRSDLKHLMGHYPVGAPDLHMSANMGELFNVIRRNHVQLPANTFLLLKTMAMVQSLGRGLDTKYDFFGSLQPHIEKLYNDRFSLTALLHRLPAAAVEMVKLSAGFPKRLLRIVKSMERGELNIKTDVSGLERHLEHLERIVNRLIIGILLSSLFIAIALIILALHR
ncbi:MAG TPA: AarF/ABC1/UbiB kinase family protein [Dehalococcoidales bacterium]|nr:AarF/ABC1/UbiB kinase family protein [Dehalococcoidales bacterium]